MTAETLILLEQKFPEATKAECRRFWDACRRNNNDNNNNNEVVTAGTKDATVLLVETEKALEEYLEWRRRLGMDDYKGNDSQSIESENNNNNNKDPITTNHHDAMLWKKSCHRCEQIMMRNQQVSSNKSSRTKEKRKTKVNTAKTSIHVPQFVFSHNNNNNNNSTNDRSQVEDNQGNQILHVLPALMDIQNVTAEWYGRTLQFYLDGLLNRESHDKVTVLLDVRPGEGWPNPMAVFMVNFIRKIAKMLQGRFPGRLEKLIVFPVPKPALGIFHAVRWALPTELAEKIVLVSGSAERKSPLPNDELKTYIAEDVLEFTETVRVAKFVPE
ncbi:CRAL/TRIO domain containing protein [Nitzschia inconspicua]|uniref:CRAL/TRIO domain containing protein n=1 Tax=Nitzschia inconspicua TaxID=303405 RepID=A0A9K3LCG6_9STRA|nr:CRAL/TRIO domain containing protein [Nitzschia inconspicua]